MFLSIILASATILTNAAQVAEAVLHSEKDVPFALEGVVAVLRQHSFTLGDASGCISLQCKILGASTDGLALGDVVRAEGRTIDYARGIVLAECASVARLAHGDSVASVANASISSIMSGVMDYRPVRTTGALREVFQDEIEPNTIYMALSENGLSIYLTLNDYPEAIPDVLVRLRRLIGSKVAVDGICVPFNRGYRRLLGRSVMLDKADAIVPLHGLIDRSAIPEIDDIAHIDPTTLSKMGMRRTRGRVIAVCADGAFYIRDAQGEIRRIRTTDTTTLPVCGDGVEAVGFPETDLYRINLSSAEWRRFNMPPDKDMPTPKQMDRLVRDRMGHPKIDVVSHGSLIRISGVVSDGFTPETGSRTFELTENGQTIRVDATSAGVDAPTIQAGSRVEATGVAIVDTETWNPHSTFPHAKEIFVTVRRAGDIRIVAHPPWWTPGKLLIVIGGLAFLLAAGALWIRMLNRVILRRSHLLAKERLAHDKAEARIDERTRLAVELHDALSQTLTGVAFHIEAAETARRKDPAKIEQCLAVARQTLASCREELCNCLWDLRNNALDSNDVKEAIRKTIQPHAGSCDITINVDIPRAKLSDSTFHAVLRIARELVVNAIRHGGARHVDIIGRLNGKAISLDVVDDGSGFNQSTRPGLADGHFGLHGISERVDRLGGSLSIDSAPGHGTHISITIRSNQ